MHDPQELLIIGYGNTLRRDDGVGPEVAGAVAALNLPHVRVVTCQQLVPELAGAISQAAGVVFVDADANAGGEVALRPIKARAGGRVLAHAIDPRSLLALAGQLFGRVPQAWLLAIPVEDLGMGDGLSFHAMAGFEFALEKIQLLAARLPSG